MKIGIKSVPRGTEDCKGEGARRDICGTRPAGTPALSGRCAFHVKQRTATGRVPEEIVAGFGRRGRRPYQGVACSTWNRGPQRGGCPKDICGTRPAAMPALSGRCVFHVEQGVATGRVPKDICRTRPARTPALSGRCVFHVEQGAATGRGAQGHLRGAAGEDAGPIGVPFELGTTAGWGTQ